MIVLDTHVLVWLVTGDRPIGKQSLAAYERSAADGVIAISVISYWELGMLVAKGRLGVRHAPEHYRDRLRETVIKELPLTGDVAILAAGLTDLHGDPADRFIAASAIAHGATLMTADRNLLNWRNALPRQNADR
ncbi:MAG TPA: type II toxin-antitoxin system VapC family toxin [Pseudolabrys sp.]